MNKFIKLFAALEAEQKNRLETFKTDLNGFTNVNDILNKWQFKDLLTPTAKAKEWELNDLKNYLILRREKSMKKTLSENLKHLEQVSEAGEIREIYISVEWKKSRTWGANPTAEAQLKGQNNYNRYSSGSIGGCGYDKESTAVAKALNQDLSLLKLLYTFKENNFSSIENRDLFGYGSGYGILPRFEGGVGVSCYPAIFQKLGFKWQQVGNGKMYNSYLINLI
jgi:hypothetical protein